MEPKFEDLLATADKEPLTGWDLSYGGRILTSPPWNFEATVDHHARSAEAMLDLGTGGGEWLSQRPFRPARTVATEGWPPNVPIARARLEPLGVRVVFVEEIPDNAEQTNNLSSEIRSNRPLPFPNRSFDLITSRHESFLPCEIARLLIPGGRFLTQQIASDFNADFLQLLDLPFNPPTPSWNLSVAHAQLDRAALTIVDSAEGSETLTFPDIGAFAWYLKNVPFVVPDFSIPRFRDRLEFLHHRIQEQGPLTATQSLFRIEAVR